MEDTYAIELETVQVKIPKAILQLLSDFLDEPINTYIERSIITAVKADLEADALISHEKIIQKYNLAPVFQNHP
jgi:hypothetical protein